MEKESRPKPTTAPRIYLDFEPSSEWVEDDKFETLLINLPGFKREQIKVQIDNSRNLRASGERPLDSNRWSRFRKDLRVADTLNIDEIRAKFENATLYIILPKLITPAADPPAPQQPPSLPTPQKLAATDTAQKASAEAAEAAADQKQENAKAANEEELTREPAQDVGKVEGGATSIGAGAEKKSGGDARKAAERSWGGATGLVLGMWKPEQLVVNVVVAVIVLVGLGIYVTYKVRKASAGES